ncbi:MAG: hypothetical protein ACLPZM_04025 [Thermoplasmata archaeon]
MARAGSVDKQSAGSRSKESLKRHWRIITVVVVVIIAVLAAVLYVVSERQTVDVTGVHYEFLGTDAPNCGWSNLTGPGVSGLNDGSIQVSTPLTTPSGSGPCLIGGVSAVTGGFSVTNVAVPANMGGGIGGTLTVTLTTPTTGFTGILYLDVAVKLPGGGSP